MSEETGAATLPVPEERPSRPSRPSRLWRGAAGLILIAIVLAGFSLAFWKYRREEAEREILSKALITAVLNDDEAETKRLLERGADPNTRFGEVAPEGV